MPGIEDWVTNPLSVINSLFDGDCKSHSEKVLSYFGKRLEDTKSAAWIPLLNGSAPHDFPAGSLVRFRCMVQDMYDPEFYLGAYEVLDTTSNSKKLVSGMFGDIARCQENEQLDIDSPNNITMDRQTLYCVPIPGESKWTKEGYLASSKASLARPASTSASNIRSKRTLEEEDGCGDVTSEQVAMETEDVQNNGLDSSNKRTKTAIVDNGTNASRVADLNFPLPGEQGPACLVKIYTECTKICVNDMLEVVGVLSNDPALASFPDEEKKSSFVEPATDMVGVEEEMAHSPPPSLVPRLHAVAISKLSHNNPHLPNTLTGNTHVESLLAEAADIRQQLLTILTEATLGDHAAAEFLLCHLISTVYARADVVPLGKFSLNLSGCPRNSSYAKNFYALLEQLVSTSHYIPMTLTNMNESKFCPKKDYTENRLKSGILQLAANTNLVVDETVMSAGQLNATGVQNLTALGNVIRWQKCEYDFGFHKQEFETNLAVMVLSEGKSMIECDARVILHPSLTISNYETHITNLLSKLTSPFVEKVRSFLTLVRLKEYSLPETMQKDIEEDFVEMRKQDSKNLTVEDFHSLLVLARLLSLSHGRCELTKEDWQHAKQLEQQRKMRLTQSNPPAS